MHCGAESSCNDWRWQRARMKSDLILRRLSLNSRTNVSVQGRNKYVAERYTGRVRQLGQQSQKWTCFLRVGGIIRSTKVSQGRSQRGDIKIPQSIFLHAQVCVCIHAQIFDAVSMALSQFACQCSLTLLKSHVPREGKILRRIGWRRANRVLRSYMSPKTLLLLRWNVRVRGCFLRRTFDSVYPCIKMP